MNLNLRGKWREMIIWGWGKTTKKYFGQVFERLCTYCHRTEDWQLCIVRTWFTLFFIPLIPYRTLYCVVCPSCGSYCELKKEEFEQMKIDLLNASRTGDINNINVVEDNLKYSGKTENQINYLKEMEEFKSRQLN